MEYKHLSQEEQDQILEGTLKQAEADHLRATYRVKIAKANGNADEEKAANDEATDLEKKIKELSK